MKQEDKELLLKDLCARLPYGAKVQVEYDAEEFGKTTEIDEITMIDKYGEEILLYHAGEYFNIEEIKPYLRPMSNMTEEEKDKLQLLHDIICDENYGDRYSPSAWSTIDEWVDYCNSRHLDYHGLIPMGLALEAPENMYSIELK